MLGEARPLLRRSAVRDRVATIEITKDAGVEEVNSQATLL